MAYKKKLNPFTGTFDYTNSVASPLTLTSGEIGLDYNTTQFSVTGGKLTLTGIANETDPIVGAINGIVKANGAGVISAASAGSDYLSPAYISDTVYGAGWNGDTTHAPSKNAVYDKIEAIGGAQDPVTLDINADTILSLTGQALGLDTQTQNTIFAGRATVGAAQVPTFRALVPLDIPDISATYLAVGATAANSSLLESHNAAYFQVAGAYLTGVTADSPLSGAGTSASHLVFTNPGYLTGVTADSPLSGAGTSASHLVVDLSSKQAASSILTALAGLTYVAGSPFVIMTGAASFSLDTNTYLTAEADTLATVTGRGALTATSSLFQNALAVEFGKDVAGGSPNVGGKVKFWSIGDNAFYTTIAAATNTASLDITLPSAPPAGTYLLNMTNAGVVGFDSSTYLASLNGAVLTDQTVGQTVGTTGARLTMLWATDITVTNAITGGVTGNAGTVTNATFTTALTVNTGTLTLTANAANNSVLTIGAGAVSVSGANTGDQTLASLGAEAVANKATSTSLGTSDTLYPSQNAVKVYVDNVAQGLSGKTSAVVATTTTLPSYTYNNGASGVGATITAVATGVLTIDGHDVALNEYILVKNETATNQPYNGLYKCTVAGAIGVAFILTRAVEMDTTGEFTGAYVFIETGTTNVSSGWISVTTGNIVVGTDNVNFTQFSGAGEITAGAGLTKTGNTLDVVGTANRIVVGADAVDIGTDVITLTGSQALTNKDLTGAGNTFPTFNQNTTGTAANLSGTPTVPNGTAATTQSANDNSTKLATTAYADLKLPKAGGVMTGKVTLAGSDTVGATYAPSSGAQTVALDCATNNMHIVTGNVNGTAITFTVANATNSQPFIVSILQGGTTVSTITGWFATVRWAGGVAPTLTATLNKRDTFGFIRTGANTYDGFVIGANC